MRYIRILKNQLFDGEKAAERNNMETREELLEKLGEAKRIIMNMSNEQAKINQIRSNYKQKKEFKKKFSLKKKRYKVLLAFIIWILLNAFGTHMLYLSQSGILSTVTNLISYIFNIAICVVVVVVYIRFKNNKKKIKVDQQNAAIEADNIELSMQEDEAKKQLDAARREYNEKIASWYPEHYCNNEAVQFLYNSVSNYRAESLKEAINLYEAELRDRRIESNYQNNMRH